MPDAPKLEAPQGQPLFDVQFRAISESLAGNGVVAKSDLEVTDGTNAMEIDVASGTVYYIATEYTFGGAAPAATLTTGDGTYDRWDTIAFDTADSTITVHEGTPEQYPTPPDIAGGEMLLAIVYVPAGATDIGSSNILNWRATFSNEAEDVHYDDTQGFYGVSSVEAALDTAIDKFVDAAGDSLTGALDVSGVTPAPVDLGLNPGLYSSVIDAAVDGTDAAGIEESYTFSVDGTDLLKLYAESDGAGGIQNTQIQMLVDVSRPAGDVVTADLAADAVTSAKIATGAVGTAQISDGTIVDGDISGSTTIARGKLQDQKLLHTETASGTNGGYTTADEEVVLVDTATNATAYTVTLASADAAEGNFIQVSDFGGGAQANNITVDTEGTETIDGVSSQTISTDYGSIVFVSNGNNWFTGAKAGGALSIEDNGTTVLNSTTGIDFGVDLIASDNGDGTVTVDSDAGGVNVLATGTFTHTGGSATSTTVAGVTSDQTTNLYVEVGVDSDPSFNANYAWDYTWGEAWDDTNSEKDVTVDATWDTDPGSGNDVVLDYRIYTLDVSISKSRIQDLVDSPNGHVPTALLEDTESVEITLPVPDGETLKVYRWGCYQLSDGTAPTGLQVQLLDGAGTVQASANTVNTENVSSPVASYTNSSGSLAIFKLRVNNGTGNALTTDGAGGHFAYVVEP